MTTNPLLATLDQTRQSGRMALCGYFLTGYPSPDDFYRMVRAAKNLDVIEFGIPADEPKLDGPVIANAHEIVTQQRGIHAEPALALLGGLSNIAQPRFVMTYTTDGRALDGFLQLCAKNGIQGVLAPDIDMQEGTMVATQARALGLASITLMDARADDAALEWSVTHGDIIYVKAAAGRTGEALTIEGELYDLLGASIQRIRALNPAVKIGFGIGLQKPEQIAALAALDIDMAIVGTKIIEYLEKGEQALVEYIQTLHDATAYPNK